MTLAEWLSCKRTWYTAAAAFGQVSDILDPLDSTVPTGIVAGQPMPLRIRGKPGSAATPAASSHKCQYLGQSGGEADTNHRHPSGPLKQSRHAAGRGAPHRQTTRKYNLLEVGALPQLGDVLPRMRRFPNVTQAAAVRQYHGQLE